MIPQERIDAGLWWSKPLGLVDGCTPCGAGCLHCWSALAAYIRSHQKNPLIAMRYAGLAEKGPDGPRFTGVIRTRPDALQIPLRARQPQVYAVWNDLGHPQVPDDFIAETLNMMVSWPLCCRKRGCDHEDVDCWRDPGHTYLILTKRPERMAPLLLDGLPDAVGGWPGDMALPTALDVGRWPPAHIWLGATASNQAELDRVAPHLARLAAAGWNTFLSLEPLVEPIAFRPEWFGYTRPTANFRTNETTGRRQVAFAFNPKAPRLGQVIVGGETGHGARPMHLGWARQVRDDCADAGVPFFFKQWGEWAPDPAAGPTRDTVYRVGRRRAGRVLDGRVHNALAWNAEGPRKGKR